MKRLLILAIVLAMLTPVAAEACLFPLGAKARARRVERRHARQEARAKYGVLLLRRPAAIVAPRKAQ